MSEVSRVNERLSGPSWETLAAKYGTCQDQSCPATNWGGRNRLHLRDEHCPPPRPEPTETEEVT